MGFNDANIFVVPPEVNAIMGVVDTYARWKQSNGGPRGYEKYHPSAFGKCLRQMQYLRYEERGLLKSKPQEFDSKLIRLFDKGHNMHARWTHYFEGIGVLRGVWECTNPMCANILDNGGGLSPTAHFNLDKLPRPRRFGYDNILGCFKPDKCECGNREFKYHEITVKSEELNMYGHADMILDFSNFDKERFSGVQCSFNEGNLPKSPIVVDMKTVNDFRYQQLLKQGPSLGYRIQLVIYANLLNVDYGLLIYENKNNSVTASYKIEKDTDTAFKQISQQAKTMNEMVDRKLLPPPRPADQADYECSNCSFKQICHNSKIWEDPDLHKKRKNFYGNLL